MPRPLLIRCDNHPYHVTARTNNQMFFPLPLNEVWNIALNELLHVHKEYKLAIHAFVLMGNHFHLLCHTPDANLDQAMHALMRNLSVRISRKTESTNHLWGGRYRWSLIDNQAYYYQVYRYIYQNPLRAGIASKVEDFPYSTITGRVPFPIHTHIPMSFGGEAGELHWLNDMLNTNDLELIKLGLRKSQFGINKRKLTKRC